MYFSHIPSLLSPDDDTLDKHVVRLYLHVSTHPCKGLWETGTCVRSRWSSISSELNILGHDRSSPRRQPQSRWLSLEVDSCPASPPTPTEGTHSWSHTPSASWGRPAGWWMGEEETLVSVINKITFESKQWIVINDNIDYWGISNMMYSMEMIPEKLGKSFCLSVIMCATCHCAVYLTQLSAIVFPFHHPGIFARL